MKFTHGALSPLYTVAFSNSKNRICQNWIRCTYHCNSTLIFGDAKARSQNSTLYSCLNASKSFNQPTDLLLLGEYSKEIAQEFQDNPSVRKIYIADGEATNHSTADSLAERLSSLIKEKGFSTLVGAASSSVKDIFPRCAAHLDVQPISEVISIKDSSTFVRSSYAGNAITTVKSSDPIKIISIRPTSFSAENNSEFTENSADIEYLGSIPYKDIKWVADIKSELDTVQLETAKIVVCGGRGLKSDENFAKLLEPLCRKLNAALGASRAAVDSGFAPNDLQIGQSGKVVAPELYIAIGVSGAIQHLAGMKDSKVIAAINKDPEAPIFEVADYGLVADLFQAVPELNKKIISP